MRRLLSSRSMLALTGVVVVVGALWYVARPAGHVPLYDANLVRLAESDLQGYCAGRTLWNSGGYGDAGAAARCRRTEAARRSDTTNPGAVPPAFCRAIVSAGWEGDVQGCLAILSEQQLWPTYDGALTNQWNRARQYPVRAIATDKEPERSKSRTGDRPDQQRQVDPRGDRGY